MEKEIKTDSAKPAAKNCWCVIDGQHWFIKLFMAAVMAAFLLVLGYVMADTNSGCHKNYRYIFDCQRCAMQAENSRLNYRTAQKNPQTITSSARGAATAETGLANPYELKDLADVFTVSGTIVEITDSGLTLTIADEAEKTVLIGSDTIVKNANLVVELSSVQAGDNVSVINFPNSDGTMAAKLIRILEK